MNDGKLYAYVIDGATSPQDFNGTHTFGTGRFVEIEYYNPGAAGTNGYDALGFATQAKQDELYAAAGAFKFSRPEDLATNPQKSFQVAFASTGRGQTFPADNWGNVYVLNLNVDNLTADIRILYSGDDAGDGLFAGPDDGLRSPDNLDWSKDGYIYVQEDRSTNPASLFGGTSGEEASIWRINPFTGEMTRIAQVDRSSLPVNQTDSSPADIGNWETSGITDVSDLFDAEEGYSLFLIDAQAHSVRDGVISSGGLGEGGQILFIEGLSDFLSGSEEVDQASSNDSGLFIYPNPFNQTLLTTFELNSNSDVRIDLTNVSGQLVQTLYRGTLPAGPHTLPLQVKQTPNGVYALTLITSTQVITEMVIKSE